MILKKSPSSKNPSVVIYTRRGVSEFGSAYKTAKAGGGFSNQEWGLSFGGALDVPKVERSGFLGGTTGAMLLAQWRFLHVCMLFYVSGVNIQTMIT